MVLVASTLQLRWDGIQLLVFLACSSQSLVQRRDFFLSLSWRGWGKRVEPKKRRLFAAFFERGRDGGIEITGRGWISWNLVNFCFRFSGVVPPSQDSSAKWRFRLEMTLLKICNHLTVGHVTGILGPKGGKNTPNSSSHFAGIFHGIPYATVDGWNPAVTSWGWYIVEIPLFTTGFIHPK